jgi:hypothetical protein
VLFAVFDAERRSEDFDREKIQADKDELNVMCKGYETLRRSIQKQNLCKDLENKT